MTDRDIDRELERGLDRHGGDLARWPEALRAAASARAERDPDFQKALAAAQRLDALLADAAAPAPADAALIGRVVAGAGRRDAGDGFVPTRRLAGFAAAGLAAVFVIGFAAGLLLVPGGSEALDLALLLGGGGIGDFL